MAVDVGLILDVLDTLAAPAEFIAHRAPDLVFSWLHGPVSDLIGMAIASPSVWLAYRRGLRPAIIAALIVGPGLWFVLTAAFYIWALVSTRPGHYASGEAIPILALWMAFFVLPPLVIGIPLANWLRQRREAAKTNH